MASHPIILNAFAASSCPVKVQNTFLQLRATAPSPVPNENSEFEQKVLATLRRFHDSVDLGDLSYSERLDATRKAVNDARTLIISPAIGSNAETHRCGQPDFLVKDPRHPDANPQYLPVTIKHHRVLERCFNNPDSAASKLDHPTFSSKTMLNNARFRFYKEADLLELAHYWRQLEDLGWAGTNAVGGVIGMDEFREAKGRLTLADKAPNDTVTLGVTWVSLTARKIKTFARTSASNFRFHSALERYDHEFTFRVKVAEVAVAKSTQPELKLMVQPIVIRECETCRWWPSCALELPDDDLSLNIDKSPLDAREISSLRKLGVTTVEDLAQVDMDVLLPRYLPEVEHRTGARERLLLATRRAKMITAGIDLERTTADPIQLPEGRWEVDLDIETSASDQVYLWGFLIHDRDNPRDFGVYRSFSLFTDFSLDAEVDLARRALSWLWHFLEAHPDAKVYHYSDYEVIHINTLTAQMNDSWVPDVPKYMDQHFFDLFKLVRSNFFGAHGLGLKVVANRGAGFNWRDDDPSGLNSQSWFDDAVHSPDPHTRQAAKQRVLEYNEDDVRATLALRQWLRKNPQQAGAGLTERPLPLA